LGKIATRFNCPLMLIKKSNQLTSDTIRVGQRLRIFLGEFAATVSISENKLVLTDRGHFFKQYRVGTGQHSKTPVGEFRIVNRQEQPVWYRGDREIPYGDPENILGTHWLGLDIPGFGLHGTWDNESVGKQSTAGCIRLTNDDIAELYAMLPLGTPVTIRE
ncbi:MAG: L,D-transpeptidase family protein, partial [Verrucomicrobiae bacterium]|nr:L,D-transpeptidase family protein [Verrucomicrobiae bacterium]